MKSLRITTLVLFVFGMLQSQAQVPVLNSYPAAAATIYLDFDGHYFDGTSWNWDGPITCGPANLAPDQITEVFNRIAEDYRPFNVNITTDSTVFEAPSQRCPSPHRRCNR